MESLTVSSVHCCINQVLDDSAETAWQNLLKERSFRLEHATTSTAWKSLLEFIGNGESDNNTTDLSASIPYFFGLGLYSNNRKLCGVITLYLAYSTWDGRCLFIDRLDSPDPKDADLEKTLLRPLTQIAVKLKCARLNWRKIDIPTWYKNDPLHPPEILHDWLTLRMDRPAMITYTGAATEEINASRDETMLSLPLVHESVKQCLATVNDASSNNNFRFRLATGADVDTIARLVQGLAVYEKEPDAVNVTSHHYLCDGGSDEPLFYCLLLEDAKSPPGSESYCCGMAFFYFGYESGRGRFLYLEDLYLEDAYRKLGGGSLAMKSLARICLALDCQNFYWVALDWNTPALNLYEKIGAKVQQGVLTVRFTNDKLKSFAGI